MDKSEIENLQKELAELEYRIENPGDFSDYRELHELRDKIQRTLSLLQGKETAVLLDWKYPWCRGAPIPHVVSSGYTTFLIYRLLQVPHPGWDGSTVRIISGNEPDPIAVVEFHSRAFRFGGYYNEDNLDTHPLYEHGLRHYEAHEIINSSWLEEIDVNREIYKHYFFAFHDECFECLANKDCSVEVFEDKPFCDVVLDVTGGLFKTE